MEEEIDKLYQGLSFRRVRIHHENVACYANPPNFRKRDEPVREHTHQAMMTHDSYQEAESSDEKAKHLFVETDCCERCDYGHNAKDLIDRNRCYSNNPYHY